MLALSASSANSDHLFFVPPKYRFLLSTASITGPVCSPRLHTEGAGGYSEPRSSNVEIFLGGGDALFLAEVMAFVCKILLDFSHVLFHGDQAKDWTYTYVEGLGRIKAQHCISRWCWMYKPGSTEWDSQ